MVSSWSIRKSCRRKALLGHPYNTATVVRPAAHFFVNSYPVVASHQVPPPFCSVVSKSESRPDMVEVGIFPTC